MSLFARIDQDGLPDTQSYYDAFGFSGTDYDSRFSSEEEAVQTLYGAYTDIGKPHKEVPRSEILAWIKNNVKETEPGWWGLSTEPGWWGLSTEPGVLFGVLLDKNEAKYVASTLTIYWEPDYFLQIFDGIWVNDYNPIRIVSGRDGDQFIPKKLIRSWEIPEWVRDAKIEKWVKKGNYNVPPWSII